MTKLLINGSKSDLSPSCQFCQQAEALLIREGFFILNKNRTFVLIFIEKRTYVLL
jgi:hypothetical protein